MFTRLPPLPSRTTITTTTTGIPDTAPPTLPARGRPSPGGGFRLEFHADGSEGSLRWLPLQEPVKPAVSVRVGHHFLSASPKVVDDFSASTLLSAMRVLQKIRNLDGPDNLASALPAAFARANQPYIEIGLLALLFPLVAVSAVGAVRNVMQGYAVAYPATVEAKLVQQQAMIDALGRESRTLGGQRMPGENAADLAWLTTLQRRSVAHFEARRNQRERGFVPLVGHNIRLRIDRVPDNGKMSLAFNRAVAEIMARRMARARMLADVDTGYQFERLEKRERGRAVAKVSRTAALLGGTGMSAMAAGMPVSAAAALADGLKAAAAHQALGQATACVMGGAQAMQLASGAVQWQLHRRERRQIGRDLEAVRQLDERHDGLGAPALRLYEDEAACQQAAAGRDMVLSALLTGGQGLMLASSVTGFFAPPVAAALAVPGAVITVVGSVGASLHRDHRDRHAGAGASAPVRAVESLGDLGPRIRAVGLAGTTAAVGEASVAQQARVEQTRMWNDILDALAKEKPMTGQTPWTAMQRYDRVVRNNRRRLGRSPVGPACVTALDTLREQRYAPGFFQRRLSDIHRSLGREMAEHPHTRFIVAQETFRQEVLFATLKALSERTDSRHGGLFHDAAGRRVTSVAADTAFFAYLAANPPADAVYRQKHNEALARHLVPGDRFARDEHHEALTDLAHTRRKRKAMAEPARLDADAETTWL